MADIFKTGDVVTTTAGRNHSPVMVITAYNEEYAVCIWYNSTTHQFEEYKFPPATLMKL